MAMPPGPSWTEQQAREVRDWLAGHQESMVADLAEYVGHESPSDDPESLRRCLDWVSGWLDEVWDVPRSTECADAGGLMVRRYDGSGGQPLLLLAHYDTVWPKGTLAQWPFHRDGDRMTGPGVFDMKAGLVQLVWAVRALANARLPRPACTLLLNGDEEIGSPGSSAAIRAEARASRAALVFEASAGGAIKTARSGVGLFTVTVEGVEAHAGLDPRAGASAIHELARQILRCEQLRDLDAGTSVNVGVVRGGTRSNVTAARASADLDIRVSSDAERRRIDDAFARSRPVNPDTRVEITGEWNRPVFERTEGVAAMASLATKCAALVGFELAETSVGGASDGNFALDEGIPVLDGLGAVGDGAHARGEYATVSGMVERAALTAAVLSALA